MTVASAGLQSCQTPRHPIYVIGSGVVFLVGLGASQPAPLSARSQAALCSSSPSIPMWQSRTKAIGRAVAGVKEEKQIPRVSPLTGEAVAAHGGPWVKHTVVSALRAVLTPCPLPALPHTPLHFSRVMQEKGSVAGSRSGSELPFPCPASALG